MDGIAALRIRVERATGLPGILDAAYDAFEGMLQVIHGQERPGRGRARRVRDVSGVGSEWP